MSIGIIMYSKMPTKRKLSDFYEFGLQSIKGLASKGDVLVPLFVRLMTPNCAI